MPGSLQNPESQGQSAWPGWTSLDDSYADNDDGRRIPPCHSGHVTGL